MSWGGKRHTKKPFVDVGILAKELMEHAELVQDLKGYESTSRTSSPDAQALLTIQPLVASLIKLAPTAEIHGKSMRNALSQLIVSQPDINNSKWNGKVWVNMRCERLTTLLTHIRELARDESQLKRTAMVLPKTDYVQLKQMIDNVNLNDGSKVKGPPMLPLTDAETHADAEPSRVLKQQLSTASDLSVDADGFPKMLQSPCKKEPLSDDPFTGPSFLRKMGSRAALADDPSSSIVGWKQTDANPSLKDALGYNPKVSAGATKTGRPKTSSKAAALPKAVAKTSLQKAAPLPKDAGVRKPWLKLTKTVGRNPPRAYICGSHDQASKVHLIVEVTEKRSTHYLKIVDHIMDSLKADSLTKNEALELRHDLCTQFH
jgi:hypothetical protein